MRSFLRAISAVSLTGILLISISPPLTQAQGNCNNGPPTIGKWTTKTETIKSIFSLQLLAKLNLIFWELSGSHFLLLLRFLFSHVGCSSGYTVGCNFLPLNTAFCGLKALISTLAPGTTLESHLAAAGCTCQNNGLGPACPAWINCPNYQALIVLGYNLENVLSNNACHCQCVPGECPAFTLPGCNVTSQG